MIADRCELVCAYFMTVITSEKFQAKRGLQGHFKKYLEWAQHQFEYLKLETFLASNPDGNRMMKDNAYCEEVMKDCAESSPEGELYVTFGKKLPDIFRGDLNLSDLLITRQLAQRFHYGPAFAITYGKIATYVDFLAHKNPALKILEIGAGTGAATEPILRSLTVTKVRNFDDWFF